MNTKICYVTPYCPPYALPVLEALSREYDMYVIFTEDGSTKGWNNFGVIRHEVCLSRFALVPRILITEYDILLALFPTYMSLIELLVCKIRGKKLILEVEEWDQPHTSVRRLVNPILKFIVRRCDAVVASGSASRAHMIDYGARSGKIFISPDVSWVEVPPRSTLPSPRGLSDKRLKILYLGRLVRLKGGDYLIRAFSKLEKERKDVELLVVGDGDFRSDLQRLAGELGAKNITFLGACAEPDRYYYYGECYVFVLPSVWSPDHCEGWGLTLNEAMQFGKPVISTDAVGGAFDLIRDGFNGFLVKNADVQSLYQALRRIVDDPILARAMGARSKKIIHEGFTHKRAIAGIKQAIAFVQGQQDGG
jgi:glycosyltransferase involved in cell wall biosynthesis